MFQVDEILPFEPDSYRGRRQVRFLEIITEKSLIIRFLTKTNQRQSKNKDKELLDILVKTDVFVIARFIKEPWVGLKQLEEFLEISPEITEENFFFNATKVCLSIKKR